MAHESRLTTEIRRLLNVRRTAALGTIDEAGLPYVSMTPFAVDGSAPCLVLLLSGLAAHTLHILQNKQVSLLITDHEAAEQPVHALGRLTLAAQALLVAPGSEQAASLANTYLQRFPDAGHIAALPDFRYVALHVQAVRQVAGFGTARDVPLEAFEALLRSL